MKKLNYKSFRAKYTFVPRGVRYKGKQSFIIFKGKKQITPCPLTDPEGYIKFEYEQKYINQ